MIKNGNSLASGELDGGGNPQKLNLEAVIVKNALTLEAFLRGQPTADAARRLPPSRFQRSVAGGTGAAVCELALRDVLPELFPITAFVGITSRTPHFRREDVADRLLLFHVERLKTFGAEGELLSELTAQRNVLMTELIGQLQRVLAALQKNKGKSYQRISVSRICAVRFEGRGCEGRLPRPKRCRATGGGPTGVYRQDDPVIELLEDWAIDHAGEEVTTAQLFGALARTGKLVSPSAVV